MQGSDRTAGSGRTFGAPGDSPTLQPNVETPVLPPGTLLAGRYELISTLGVGGMGAVYKAFDRQLTRVVALKTILPELASSTMALKRFKQEVLHAQQVVHKNVVRIFDLGEDGPTKFITMDFIAGRDLKEVIKERGKFDPKEAVGIIREVCSALEAAHAAGVVHRDLKPQNIMMENDGHVLVMDFGIAQSGQTKGSTLTVGVVGTPDYMSPEQALSGEIDARSDIFSLGIIFYEMLTGKIPLQAASMLETMFKRTKEPAVPPAEIDPSVPKSANDIIMKCLEIERDKRYSSFTEILADLETFDPEKKVSAVRLKSRLKKASRYRNAAVYVVLLLLVAAVATVLLRNRSGTKSAPVQHAPMTVLVGDFSNHTEDTVFDQALEPVVKMALEGAGFITAYDHTAVVRSLGVKVSGRLDEPAARQIAVGQGLGVVISGSLDRQGDGYTLSMKATQAVTGNVIKIAEDTASKKDQVLFVTTKLAAAIRKSLGDDTSDSALRFAMETLTATSLEAVHEYATAMDQLANGKYEEALQSFSKAVDLDQNFGLAYAGMAIASRNLGRQQDGEKYIKLALQHIDRMTDRERYRTRGSYYAILGDAQKCVEEYGTLISRFPSDAAAHNNLAQCRTQLRDMPKALEEVRQAAAILPKKPLYRNNVALYASYGTDFKIGEQEARAVQEMSPSFNLGFISLAFSQLGQGQLTEAAETYKKLQGISKQGVSDGTSGLADIAMYEGRYSDAAKLLQEGAASDLVNQFPDAAATKLVILAQIRLLQNQKGPAIAAADDALQKSKTVKIRFLAGRVYAAAGQTARAQQFATELASEFPVEPQAYGKLIQGEVALAGGDPRKAIQLFSEANKVLDTWIGRFDLGRAFLEAGQFPEADSEFDQCVNRRGQALALFLDESPTYGYFPLVYYYQGRVRQGMNSPGFADSYRTYLSIRGKAGEDPLLPDLRRRIGS
jgi:tetratricopeptide (TPR) repeat protein